MIYHLTFSVYQVSQNNLQAEIDLEALLEEKKILHSVTKIPQNNLRIACSFNC